MKQIAVEWLYEKLEYVNWMRNRDEISAGMADEWRKHYLEQAKAMEKEQMRKAYLADAYNSQYGFEQYYIDTYEQSKQG